MAAADPTDGETEKWYVTGEDGFEIPGIPPGIRMRRGPASKADLDHYNLRFVQLLWFVLLSSILCGFAVLVCHQCGLDPWMLDRSKWVWSSSERRMVSGQRTVTAHLLWVLQIFWALMIGLLTPYPVGAYLIHLGVGCFVGYALCWCYEARREAGSARAGGEAPGAGSRGGLPAAAGPGRHAGGAGPVARRPGGA